MNNSNQDQRMDVSTTSKDAYLQPTIAIRGDRVFICNVLPITSGGAIVSNSDIGDHNHAAFQVLQKALRSAGVDMADLVRLNTYYVFNGQETDATQFWERMTKVRLLYFPNPGPVATGLRVAGTSAIGALVQLEAEALAPHCRETRRRIMPPESWDWSVPLPLSQGWREGDRVWIGGQISSDKEGRTLHAGDVASQTSAVVQHILNILRDGRVTPSDLLHLKICYSHNGVTEEADARLRDITQTIQLTLGSICPAVTAFGCKMIYEGLLLEIDGLAVVGQESDMTSDQTAPGVNWPATVRSRRKGHCVQASGHRAIERGLSRAEATARSVRNCLDALQDVGASPGDIGRMTVFVSDRCKNGRSDLLDVREAVDETLRSQHVPPITYVVVPGLPDGADVQVDALAVLNVDP